MRLLANYATYHTNEQDVTTDYYYSKMLPYNYPNERPVSVSNYSTLPQTLWANSPWPYRFVSYSQAKPPCVRISPRAQYTERVENRITKHPCVKSHALGRRNRYCLLYCQLPVWIYMVVSFVGFPLLEIQEDKAIQYHSAE